MHLFFLRFFDTNNDFILYLGSTDNVPVRMEKEAGNDEIGPNDASGIVWALGVFFNFFNL